MKIDVTQPTGKFAAEIPGAIAVFEALGIDYACGGDRSLEDAAHAEGIAPSIVVDSLRRLKAVEHGESWSDRPLTELTQHLSKQHHHFVRHELGRIAMLLSDLCTPSDGVDPDLISLRSAFARLTEVVLPHLMREETSAFRAIEAMETAWQRGQSPAAPGDLAAALRQIADEHAVMTARLRTMRELRLRLADSDELSLRCMAMLDRLAELEAHLHEYMFLENWVLLPRAAALMELEREEALVPA